MPSSHTLCEGDCFPIDTHTVVKKEEWPPVSIGGEVVIYHGPCTQSSMEKVQSAKFRPTLPQIVLWFCFSLFFGVQGMLVSRDGFTGSFEGEASVGPGTSNVSDAMGHVWRG